MFQRKSLIALAVGASIVASGEACAHANMAQKDFYLTRDGRSYLEGTSAELKLNLAHSCSAALPTVITTVALPNGANPEIYRLKYDRKTKQVTGDPASSKRYNKSLADVFYTLDSKTGKAYGGNAFMGIKPSVDNNWQQIVPKTGDVPQYYNHGAQTTDVRGLHWHGGNIPNDFYYDLKFRVNLPNINPDSCIAKVRVYLPAIQYCGSDMQHLTKQDNWLPKPSPLAGITEVTPNYAPYIDIDRDMENNGLPDRCEHRTEVIGLYPADDDINDFLVHGGHGGSTGGAPLKCADGSAPNPPDHITHHTDWCTDGSTPH